VRVIAGRAKGRRLLAVPGDGTRPITDRAKEALFSILHFDLPGARLLDLFAGTGGVGIEALSRGAEWVDFVDANPRAASTVRANLRATGFEAHARVQRQDAFEFLKGAHSTYDLVFVAPPQYKGLWLQALELLDARSELVAPDGVVIVQIHPVEERELDLANLYVDDRRRYGSVLLVFLRAMESKGPMPVTVSDGK